LKLNDLTRSDWHENNYRMYSAFDLSQKTNRMI